MIRDLLPYLVDKIQLEDTVISLSPIKGSLWVKNFTKSGWKYQNQVLSIKFNNGLDGEIQIIVSNVKRRVVDIATQQEVWMGAYLSYGMDKNENPIRTITVPTPILNKEGDEYSTNDVADTLRNQPIYPLVKPAIAEYMLRHNKPKQYVATASEVFAQRTPKGIAGNTIVVDVTDGVDMEVISMSSTELSTRPTSVYELEKWCPMVTKSEGNTMAINMLDNYISYAKNNLKGKQDEKAN